jgi:diaminopimelate epimerase
MKTPTNIREETGIQVAGSTLDGYFVDTGAPHFVIFCDDLESVDVERLGSSLRRHEIFQPAGTNVDFVRVLGESEIAIRTYERGVEAETLACGTGSVASAYVSCLYRGVQPPVTVGVRSGAELNVELGNDLDVWLEGGARILFDGKCLYDLNSHEISSVKKTTRPFA